jgi:hypothetical protein
VPISILNDETHDSLFKLEGNLDGPVSKFSRNQTLSCVHDCVLGSDVVKGQVLIILKDTLREILDGLINLVVLEHDFLKLFFSNDVKANLSRTSATHFNIIFEQECVKANYRSSGEPFNHNFHTIV